MSSSSEVSSSDPSSDEDIPPPPQSEMTMGPHGPPRQLCQCTKCVGQVTQKSYVCSQHIKRYGRHRGLTLGASSSHMGSSMRRPVIPPPYVPSQGVLNAIGNALLQALGLGLYGANRAVDENPPPESPPRERPPPQRPIVERPPRVPRARRGSLRRPRAPIDHTITRVDGRWGECEFTRKVAPIIKDWDPAILGLPYDLDFDKEFMIWGRPWVVKPSTLGERHGYGVFACEDIILEVEGREGPTLFPYGGPIYKRRHWNMILT
ncbi:unnamed protein product [Calypogeia fissa]